MKNLFLFVSMLLFTSIGTLFAQTYSGGAGTAENPYQISILEDLRYLSVNGEADWDKHFIMTNDIDASDAKNWNDGAGFLPIGKDGNSPFGGTFDGGGFAIDSLYINSKNLYIGLFGYSGTKGSPNTLSNIGITNCVIKGLAAYLYVGGLVGFNYSEITNCYVEGYIQAKGREDIESGDFMTSYIYSGGLIGSNRNTIKNCYTNVNIESSSLFLVTTGGLIGVNRSSDIINCFSEVKIVSNSLDLICVGGLIGSSSSGKISYCHSKSNVEAIAEEFASSVAGGFIGDNSSQINCCSSIGNCSASDAHKWETSSVAGGFIGINDGEIINSFSRVNVSIDYGYDFPSGAGVFLGGNRGDINNCYSAAGITTVAENRELIIVGGFEGGEDYWNGGSINDCFWDIDIANISESVSATPKSTAEMKDINIFLNANWDFENIWSINDTINDGYPYLQEKSVGIVESEQVTPTIQIYPNPATNQININYDGIIESIEIYNITGQLILTATTREIDVSKLPSGIYQVVLTSDGEQAVQRVIKN